MKKIKEIWLSILALMISVTCMILSISNLWLKNDKISFIIWPLLWIAMCCNFLSEMLARWTLRDRLLIKINECIDWAYMNIKVGSKIKSMELPEEVKKELLDYIEECIEEVGANRERRLKEHGLDEEI